MRFEDRAWKRQKSIQRKRQYWQATLPNFLPINPEKLRGILDKINRNMSVKR